VHRLPWVDNLRTIVIYLALVTHSCVTYIRATRWRSSDRILEARAGIGHSVGQSRVRESGEICFAAGDWDHILEVGMSEEKPT